MPGRLAYLMVIGDVEERLLLAARWCVTSLRRFGRYEDEILIITDKDPSVFCPEVRRDARILFIPEERLWDPSHGRKGYDRYLAARTRIPHFIDVENYENILYLDCDVLVIKEVAHIFDCGDYFRYSREFQPMSAPMFNSCLTEAELMKARWVRGINSGIFCAPGHSFAECMNKWNEEIDSCPGGFGYDQPALNALVLRARIRSRALPAFSVAYPVLPDFAASYRPQTIFLHYCGSRQKKFDRMERHFEELMAGKPLTMNFPDDNPFFSPPAPSHRPKGKQYRIAFNDDGSRPESYSLVNAHWSRELRRRGHWVVPPGAEADFFIHHDYSVDFPDTIPEGAARKIAARTSDFGPFPPKWVEVIERHYDQLWVHSNWVKEHALRSGVTPQRVRVIPHGIEPRVFRPLGERYPLPTTKRFKFLFVGGTVVRKGIDILLQAYTKTFSRTDDVCLVIKDNPGNVFYRDDTWRRRAIELSKDRALPEILVLQERLSVLDLASLYRACDAAVFPFRAEGFLNPALEALACGTPTIIPDIGPCVDFSSDDTSFLVPALRVKLPVNKMFRLRLGFELEIDEVDFCEVKTESLARYLRLVWETPGEALRKKGLAGAERTHAEFTWERTVDKIEACLHELADG